MHFQCHQSNYLPKVEVGGLVAKNLPANAGDARDVGSIFLKYRTQLNHLHRPNLGQTEMQNKCNNTV